MCRSDGSSQSSKSFAPPTISRAKAKREFYSLPCSALAIVIAFFILRNKLKGGEDAGDLPVYQHASNSFLSKVARIDWIGAAFFMAGGILLLLALNWGSTQQWKTAKVIACFVVGGVSIIAFVIWEYFLEKKAENPATSFSLALSTKPMVPFELFRSFDLVIVMYNTFVSGAIMLVMFYFVAIYMVIVNNESASKAGAQLIYFAPGMVRIIFLRIQCHLTNFVCIGWWFLHIHPIDQDFQATQVAHHHR